MHFIHCTGIYGDSSRVANSGYTCMFKKNGATYALIHQHDIKSDIISFQQEQCLNSHFYN